MKQVTKEMINTFDIKRNGYDFMGYIVDKKSQLSFHHLIVPRKDCKKFGIGEGYAKWNGAILVQDVSHVYLHSIQRIDEEIFCKITLQMIIENMNNKITVDDLKIIRDLLLYFEKEHINDRKKDGKLLIKDDFLSRRIVL